MNRFLDLWLGRLRSQDVPRAMAEVFEEVRTSLERQLVGDANQGNSHGKTEDLWFLPWFYHGKKEKTRVLP